MWQCVCVCVASFVETYADAHWLAKTLPTWLSSNPFRSMMLLCWTLPRKRTLTWRGTPSTLHEFIMGDYRSMTPSNITNLLKKTMTLQPPKECPQLLCLPLFYRVIEGLVLALPPDKFLSQQKPGRLIWTWQQPGYVTTNTTGDYTRNNDRACVIPITMLPPRPTAELTVKSKETVGNSWSVLKVILGHKYHHNH